MLKLIIGNKRYSSWSLRPWVLLRHFELPFEEEVIGLDLPDTADRIAKFSKAGKLPILVDQGLGQRQGQQGQRQSQGQDQGLTIWDTLAIAEYLAEKFPDRGLWPADVRARAWARSISAEMHAGFVHLRTDCSMKILESHPLKELRPETRADVERVVSIFNECLAASGGPFLFGKFSVADAMYAPVVSRFRTYALPASGAAAKYLETVWNTPAMQAWVEGARTEMLRVKRYEK